MTDKQIIKKLAERYKEMCNSPFADGYTFKAFEGRCAEQGFTIDDVRNYIEKEKQERKVKQIIDVTKCIHFDKSDIPNGCTCYWDGECNHYCYYKQLKRKEQECEELKNCLTEIKDYCNKYPQNSIGFKKHILQKINECEVYKV